MVRVFGVLAAAVVSSLSTACSFMTHELTFRGHTATAANLKHSKERKVAVVFLPKRLKKSYETATDGHAFVFNNTRQFYEQAFRSALRDSVGKVDFYGVKPPGRYDLYVYPELDLEASGMLSHDCTARFAVTVEDQKGRRLAREERKQALSFIAMADGTRACTDAIVVSFAATYDAMKKVDTP